MSESMLSAAAPGRRLGTLGCVACLVFSMAAAMLGQGWGVGAACALALLLAMLLYPVGLRPLADVRLWLLAGMLMLPACLFGGEPAWRVWRVAISQPGLATGAHMVLRAIAIVVAVAGFAASVPVGELAGLLERVGMKGLGFSLGVAINVLPVLNETATTAYQALRMRGGFRRRRLQALRLLLVTVVANSLRHADDIVSAAEARAFSVERTRPLAINWRRTDLAVAGALAAAMLVLMLVQ